MFAAVLLTLACSPTAVQVDALAPARSAFDRERRVRDAAADPAANSEWLQLALSRPEHWTEAADALEALFRAVDARPEADFASHMPAVLKLAADEHPSLRASAWRVLAAMEPSDPARLPAMRGVATWEERAERGRALARWNGDALLLRAACDDPDARVAEAALAAWFQAPEADAHRRELRQAAWLAVFERAAAAGDGSEHDAWQWLELASDGATDFAGLLARLEGPSEGRASFPAHAPALARACWARQVGSLDPREAQRLAEDWPAAARVHPRARGLLERAARGLGPEFGVRMVEQARMHVDDAERAHECLLAAVEALAPSRLLAEASRTLRDAPSLSETLWDCVRARADAWDAEVLDAWIAPTMPKAQRARVVLVVAETFRQNRDRGSESLLCAALADPDDEIAAEAFRALSGAVDPRPWMEPLHRAWIARPPRWRALRLAELSRDVAWTPFRDDLLEIASESRRESLHTAELLAPFRGDTDVISALTEWLEQDLAALRDLPRGPLDQKREPGVVKSALVLVRALALSAGDDARPGLSRALEASRDRSLELGKSAIYHLGRIPSGRPELNAWLAPGVHSRLRAEAALALASENSAAIELLLAAYESFDEDLRGRALRAFAADSDPASAQALQRAARASTSGPAETLTAIDCLGTRASREPALAQRMLEWLDDDALDLERRSLVIAALGAIDSREVRERLAARAIEIEQRRPAAPRGSPGHDDWSAERESLILALAAADGGSGLPSRMLLSLPSERAAADFAARGAGKRLAEVEFSWRAELEWIAAASRVGRLPALLEPIERWRMLDARLQAEAAQRAWSARDRASSDATQNAAWGARAIESLALSAGIALRGETTVEDSARVRFEARRVALEAARACNDWDAFAARARALERDVRSGALPLWSFTRVFGDFDPARGIDGLARLACEARLAAARAAAARGERAQVEVWLARAAGVVGSSRAASEALEQCRRELGDAR